MCLPNQSARRAVSTLAAVNPAARALPPPDLSGTRLVAFPRATLLTSPPPDEVSRLAPAPAAPLIKPVTLPPSAAVVSANLAAGQLKPLARAPSSTPVPRSAHGRPATARSSAVAKSDILTGSRYDGLHGKDLDAALKDSYRRQQATDAQAEWAATLRRITRDYQVPDDPDGMVYVPGNLSSPWNPGRVTARERRLILQLPVRGGVSGWRQFFAIRQHAVAMTGSFIGLPTREQVPSKVAEYIERTYPRDVKAWVNLWRNTDGHSDAFRHAYWNALMTKAFGPVFSQAYGTAHEGGPNNPRASEAIDLYNNEVGRTIAEDHPNASEQQLAILVRGALRKGKLVVVDQDGRLAWSNKVKWAEHSLTRRHPEASRVARCYRWPGKPIIREVRNDIGRGKQLESVPSAG